MADLGQFVKDNWKVLFGGGAAIAAAVVGALLAWWLTSPSIVDVEAVIAALHNIYREELHGKDEQIQELTKAVEALKEQAGAPDAPPGVDAALKQLAQGATASAEAIFEQVLER